MRLSLRLIITFVMVISVTAVLVMLLANRIIDYQFNTLVKDNGVRYARRLAPALARYYEKHDGWQGIDVTINRLMDNLQNIENQLPGGGQLIEVVLREDRLLLLDTSGKIVLDTQTDAPPLNLTPAMIKKGTPILTQNKLLVGTLVTSSSLGNFTPAQKTFLTQINLWMLIASLVIILTVSIASFFVAHNILAPVHSLAQATLRVAAGDYSQKLPVHQDDELGDMASSFNSMVTQLEEQRELRRRSMADVAHELRTPLSVLQVDLESIEDGLMPATPETVRGLQIEVSHINHLVEDLRMLSLVEAHELKMDFEKLNMADLVLDIVNRMGEAARAKNINLTADVQEPNLPVNGDSQRMAQVLINLISNAIQHTPAGSRVVVGAKLYQPWVQVWVNDTGVGIPAADLAHIFERFYRSDKARNQEKNGSGLGLGIARSLVEAHSGRIWAESIEGQGTTLIFTLPYRSDATRTRSF